MKKYLLFLLLASYIGNAVAQNTFTIGSGAFVTVTGAGQSVLKGVNLVNNGAYKDTSGTFVTIGSNTFSGSGITNLNNYTINSTGTVHVNSLVSVLHTANLVTDTMQANGNLFIRSDLSPFANIFVTGELVGGVQGIIASPSPVTGSCPAYTSNLTLNISGPAVLYQWQQSADSATWTSITGATSGSYVADVTASNIYYRCQLATNNSSFSQNTPGVKLNLSMGTTLAGTITGASSLCQGTGIVLSESLSGGTWNSNNTSVATVSAGGVVTGISGGTAIISYTITNACGTVSSTKAITVNPAANPGIISGSSTVCYGSSTALSSSVSGGTWTSGAPGMASVTSTGLVNGLSVGTAVISYTATNSCGTATATFTIAVNPLPNAGTITGASIVYTGSLINLTDVATGGSWSSSSGSIATVSSTGVVSGISSGGVTVSYSVTNSCGTAVAAFPITVSTLSGSGSGAGTGPGGAGAGAYFVISGGAYVKGHGNDQVVLNGVNFKNNGNYADSAGMMTTFGGIAFSGSGATWLNNLNINSTGRTDVNSLVSVNNATDLIHDTLNAGNNVFVRSDVNAAANMVVYSELTNNVQGIIVKVTTAGGACDTARLSLNISGPPVQYHWQMSADSASWSDISGATQSTYIPVVPGNNYYRCHLTSSNSSYNESTPGVKRNVLLSVQGSIAGVNSICSGTATTLTDTYTGGVWSSSNPAVASVGVTGVVSGVSGGTAVISYYWDLGCVALDTFTVNQAPGPITGTLTTCAGTTTALTDAVTGGVWSSGSPAAATVGSTGIVTGIAGGTASIMYTTGGACNTSTTVTINTIPVIAPITGATNLCVGSTTLLSDATPGGFWFSSDNTTATVSSGGLVTGVAPGNVVINYTKVNVCGVNESFILLNVAAAPAAISGVLSACVGSSTLLSDATAGGAWSSGSAGIATVGTGSGVVNGISSGTSTITYATSPACFVSSIVTINPLPDAGSISGSIAVCQGSSISLSDITGSGVWSSGNALVATVGSTGLVTGVSGGSATISYTVTNGCGNSSATLLVTVHPLPAAGTITGASTVTVGSVISLLDLGGGSGVWSSGSPGIASVGSAGIVTGVTTGTAAISYTVTNGCGNASAMLIVTVTPSGSDVAPTFDGGSSLALVVCENSGATSINALLAVTDPDAAQTETWSVASGPSNGTLSGFTTTAGSGGSAITPTGLTYTPGTGYSGTDAFTIQVDDGVGGTATTVVNVTVNPVPDAGTISGSTSVCAASNITLTDAAAFGAWSSTNTAAGTISGGVVTGIAAGTTTISYTVINSCGTAAAGITITVNATPSATITNNFPMCNGGSVILYVTPAGGTDTYSWSGPGGFSSTVQNVSVFPVTNTTYSLTVSNSTTGCASSMYTTVVTVNPTPVAAPTNSGPVCSGGGSVTLTANPGGGANAFVWSGPGGFTSSMQNPALTVTVTSTYSLTVSSGGLSGCTPTWLVYTTTVTVSSPVAAISGLTAICSGVPGTLTDATGGGTWSSSNTAVATIGSATGTCIGVAAGTATITYMLGTGCFATTVVTINATLPGSITGPSGVTVGSNITLTDAVGGGTWSTSNGNATVSSGIVTGVTVGTVTISYSVSGTCGIAVATKLVAIGTSTTTVTVAAITGYYFYMCQGATAPFFDATSGGIWSINAADAGVASVSATGVVSGLSAGTATLSYTLGTAYATAVVTVYAVPAAITGSGSVCIGQTTALSDASAGGVWSSSVPSYASVGTSGVVTGIIAGTVPIYYTFVAPAGCKTAFVVTVNPNPAGISGPANVCAGSSIQLTDMTTGGAWSTASANITVDGSGSVTGVAAGSATVTYAVAGCYRTYNISVNVPTAGAISGASSVTVGLNITLTDAMSGGVWSASNSNATISGAGLVTGVAAGTVTISYTVTGSCGIASATYIVTVNASGVSDITGTPGVCVGATTALTDATPGGTWHSSNTFVATVGTSGVVTGVAAGTAMISYTVAGVPAIAIVTVSPTPSAIGGATSVCNGSAITLSDFTAGGTWTSTAGVSVTNGTTVTTVTGLTNGTSTITYSIGTGCFKTFSVTVKSLPTPILGNLNVCGIGSVTFLSDATSGTSWVINPVGTATISASGRVYGVSAGTANVTYTASNGCVTTAITTVNAAVTVAAISGANNVSHGATITLSDITPGGIWSSSNSALGSVDVVGDVTGVGTSGTVTISYVVPYAGGGCNAIATKSITVHTPSPHSHGTVTTTVGASLSVADEIGGSDWTSLDNTIATVDGNGTVTAIEKGNTTIVHTVVNSDGSTTVIETQLMVNPLPLDVRLLPNPNNGSFTITVLTGSNKNEPVMLEITNMLGQVVYNNSATATSGVINNLVILNSNLANGMYLLNVHNGNENKVIRFVIEK